LTLSESTPRTVRTSRRQELLDAIVQEEARLVRLDAEQADARIRLAALRSERASLGSEPQALVEFQSRPDPPAPQTPAEKIRLFRSHFRGREDVFQTRFVSKRTGKPGYAPVKRPGMDPCSA
jgi:hypothetical protein